MVVFHYQGLTHSFVSVAYVASCCGFSSLGRRNSWMGLTQSVTSLQSSCHFARTGGWPMMGSKGNMRQAIFLKIYVCRQIISEPFSAVTPQLLPQLCQHPAGGTRQSYPLGSEVCPWAKLSYAHTIVRQWFPPAPFLCRKKSRNKKCQKISKNHSESIFRGLFYCAACFDVFVTELL